MEKVLVGLQMSRRWTDPPIVLTVVLLGLVPALIIGTILAAIYVTPFILPIPPLLVWVLYTFVYLNTPASKNTARYLKFNDKGLEKQWGKRKIPVGVLYEAFIRGRIDIIGDVHTALMAREEYICYRPTFQLVKFLLAQFVPATSSSFHNQKADKKEISLHYDRGNDFFAGFLGPSMVYTSGIYHGLDQTLEMAQKNKCSVICDKLQLKPQQRHLDIGCGWGTLARHSAKYFRAESTGVTLSKEGAAYCVEQNEKENLTDRVTIMHRDYRDIPEGTKYNAVSAIEMAEHVGLNNFQSFLGKVQSLMYDDGLFMMQVAGLRRGSDWQDVQWGLFMAKYIFPGADASTPLAWYIGQMEQAGFEVRSVETIGKHYSHTLYQWYLNWEANKGALHEKYGEALLRLWSFFLAWSAIASGQGTATCYQILAHKNTSEFDRNIFTSGNTNVGLYNEKSVLHREG